MSDTAAAEAMDRYEKSNADSTSDMAESAGVKDPRDASGTNRDIRILFADDDRIIREGLTNLLNYQDGITMVVTAENETQALKILATQPVNVALIDVDMPVLDGIQAARHIAGQYPKLAVVILTIFKREESFARSLGQNVRRFLARGIPPDRLAKQLKCAHAGERVLGPRPTGMLTSNSLAVSSNTPEYRDLRRHVETFPPYLHDVFGFVIETYPSKAIARRLKLSENIVRTYVSELFVALDFISRSQLTITALKTGY